MELLREDYYRFILEKQKEQIESKYNNLKKVLTSKDTLGTYLQYCF